MCVPDTPATPDNRRRRPTTCQWCGKAIESSGRGRPRKYCSATCRQRAYEQRHNLSGRPIPADAVVITPERAEQLRDGLFEVRCAAEDVATAAGEGAGAAELEGLCSELVALARRVEKLR